MKKSIVKIMLILATCSVFALPGVCQYAFRIRPSPALPASCNPLNGDVVMLTAGAGASPGVYNCTMLNTWRPIGVQNNQFNMHQGIMTASQPFFNQTATWNNGAVTFSNFDINITDTASAAGSFLANWSVGGAGRFQVYKSGLVYAAGGILTGAATNIGWSTRTTMSTSADGVLNLLNSALAGFTRISFGPETAGYPAITVPAPVGGFTQGIIITRGDGNVAVFGDLGAATNGSIIYCSDCTIASPCAGAGTGALAKRLNGVWVCN